MISFKIGIDCQVTALQFIVGNVLINHDDMELITTFYPSGLDDGQE